MSHCPHCGGLVGRDCYNVEECGYVSQMMQQEQQREQAEEFARQYDLLSIVSDCQKLLSDLTNGDREFQRHQSSAHLWVRCVELEARCRAAASAEGRP